MEDRRTSLIGTPCIAEDGVDLWRLTHGQRRKTTQVALLDIAEATGLSKRAVQSASAASRSAS